MVSHIKRATSPMPGDYSKGESVKTKAMRLPVIDDLPLQLPQQERPIDIKSRNRILRAFKRISEKSDCSLAIMQKLFNKKAYTPRLLKAFIQPLK